METATKNISKYSMEYLCHCISGVHCDIRKNRKPDGWNSDQEWQHFRVVHSICQCFGSCIFSDRCSPDSRQNIPWSSPSWAKIRTITALMAQPDVTITYKSILKTPGSSYHFFSWERTVFRSNRACNRTTGALVTFFQCFAAKTSYLSYKVKIRLSKIFFSHIYISPKLFFT